ncbi:L-fucose: permease [Azotobacter vinelandii CA]|uniref:L-fucose: permease n=3 Tax=Azotobacter vinelandii TaxID=354 RepID=C1DIC3_AZOVD|nr:L-fucose:H+ symporter permease [Azotobacter vinelandii]ACO76620.1 L-fucose: permease [Azotobacter vinelandii DJ]AGK13536.1 L-fucose: permease [Azotobacter vinelandii CA]AGK17957.1 L-fucose: permease [Azotobacter vinelandii CA6]SFX12273.1 MFS transporter, FHS family, L-fucose permease [Azotobacter vinelandii]GLK58796.1 MFS transporter [Azotobacter vinelandii]
MPTRREFVYRDKLLPFILLVCCFAAWGVVATMTDPLVQVFSTVFSMSTLQASLVQFAYYGAYFLLALPAAFINQRYSYKTGVLVGLGLAIVGALLFYPASLAMTYGLFLLALFTLAGGLAILETSANPFVISMGPEGNATRRLNLAQAFNPVGTNIGVLLAATLILPNLHAASSAERAAMTQAELLAIRSGELQAVMLPYVGFAFVLLAIWIGIALTRMPAREKIEAPAAQPGHDGFPAVFRRLMRNTHYRWGVVALFFYIAAQTCTWTFTIQYAQQTTGADHATAGYYLQYSMIVFLVARFVATWAMGYVRPSILLALLGATAAGLCLYAAFAPGLSGVWALVAVSACLSLMFPTIYGIALMGLGEDAKFAAGGLVMTLLGGALMPMVQGAAIDAFGAATSFVVTGLCFLPVVAYGLFHLSTSKAGPFAFRSSAREVAEVL